MIVTLSPSKSLDYDSPLATERYTQPDFLDDAQALVDILRGYDVEGLGELMGISENLSELNVERFQSWSRPFTPDNARQALLAFDGDVYTDIGTDSYDEDDFAFAQDHVRTLSGLYGLLRPLDLIQPYRLEMGTRLENSRGKNLYAFWGARIARALNEALAKQGDDVVVNLASKEYFKAIDQSALDARIVTPVFQQLRKNGDYRIVAIYAKRARGTMTDWIVRHRITEPAELAEFAEDGYRYDAEASTEDDFVFLRDEKP